MSISSGEWRIERRHDGKPFGISSPETMRDDTDCLCLFGPHIGEHHDTEAHANLIAAAPELLAACKEALADYRKAYDGDEFEDKENYVVSRGVIEGIKAAIAKADPQQPLERVPAECIPVSEFIAEELRAREWSEDTLAERMGGGVQANHHTLSILNCNDPTVHLSDRTAYKLAHAFGTSVTLWLNLDAAWRKWRAAQPTETKGGDCRE